MRGTAPQRTPGHTPQYHRAMTFSSTASSHSAASALQGALRPTAQAPSTKPRLLVAGATGLLGAEVLRRLAGSGRFAHTEVLASEPMATGLSSVGIVLALPLPFDAWPTHLPPAQVGVVMFEPPRLHYDRERALWTPAPEQLVGLAQWLQRCGVQTLVVVLPHAQGRLPEALRHGLANLDEHAMAALGFERLLIVRSAQKLQSVRPARVLERVAAWMLSTLSYMIPASELPVRPSKLAAFIEAALRVLPPGTHVASPELLFQAAQGKGDWQGRGTTDMQQVVQAWLNRAAPEDKTAFQAP